MSNFLLDNRLIFVHLPRTGGSSIRKGVFAGKCEGPVFGKIPNEWRGFPSFTIVRNPFDRLVSAWKMCTDGVSGKRHGPIPFLPPETSLVEFLGFVIDKSVDYRKSSSGKCYIKHHTLPQTHPWNCLQLAEDVARFENYDRDVSKILIKNGFSETGMPHWNRTKHKDYRQYFNDQAIEITRNYYKEDLAELGYEL